ncbi:MAG: adenylate/guanylate cyclase domain-containing protein [Geminicoccaceae bacterium]
MAWLRELGLEQYVQVFADHAIDFEVLVDLDDTDLEKLGILLGHRKKLLRAIAALREEPIRNTAAALPAVPVAPTVNAERRQITVMFVDLVDSTALSTRLDPEDLGRVLGMYQTTAAGEIAAFGGHVAQFMGDGILAYFGWPKAQENAAERAVRTALAIIEAVGRLRAPDGTPIEARIGIATGLVVAGDVSVDSSALQTTVVGETPNLAARLQSLAVPGTVVIARSTHRLVADKFDCHDLGAVEMKGFTAPVHGFRVVGPRGVDDRPAREGATKRPPLVNGHRELALLDERWRTAKEGNGQVVLISGEAGIGKSRMVAAFRERLRSENVLTMRYQGSPYYTGTTLYPVVDQFTRAAGFARGDDVRTRVDKLARLLGEADPDVATGLPFILELLSLVDDRYTVPAAMTPHERRAATFRALLRQLEGLAARAPVCIVLEDAHWLDPTTTEMFGQVIERLVDLPALLVVTFRPDFAPPWRAATHVTTVSMSRLAAAAAEALVGHLMAGRRPPNRLINEILAKTDGVPLFVEELTKAVLETGLLRDENGEDSGATPQLAIPSTLQDSLMARLDRLGDMKQVAQVGSALGRSFSYELISFLSPLPATELDEALRQLTDSQLIYTRGTPPNADYVFKHALVQETAYESMLRSRRRSLHRQIAETLVERFPETERSQPEILAHHFALGGEAQQAIDLWTEAGRRAAQRSADAEALNHFESALDLLHTLPAAPERDHQALSIRVALLTPVIAIKGYASPETASAVAAARSLSEKGAAPGSFFPIMYGEWTSNMVRGNIATARTQAERFFRLAEAEADSTPLIVGRRMMGFSLFGLGELPEASRHLHEVMKLYDPALHASSAFLYGHDSRVSALCFEALTLLVLGRIGDGLDAGSRALRFAEAMSHANTQAIAMCLAGALVQQLVGDAEACRELATRTIELAEQRNLALWIETGRILEAWAIGRSGQPERALVQITSALERFGAIGTKLFAPHFMSLRAALQAELDQIGAGLRTLAAAQAMVRETGERVWEADLLRMEGDLHLMRPGADAQRIAEQALLRALELSRQQSARLWELRASLSLARLWLDRGDGTAARKLLRDISSTFAAEDSLPELVQARSLLTAGPD